MNNQNTSRSASFQTRNARATAFRPRPIFLTAEDESEGVELFLRGLLMLSLVVSLAICNLYITAGHSQPSVLPGHDTAVAITQPVAVPVAEAL